MTVTTFMDRTGWAAGGPWDDEPDREQWTDDETGLDCLIRRGPSGALCGYVAVAHDHPWFEVHYSDCTAETCDPDDYCYEHTPGGQVDVHGGLTYSFHCDGDTTKGICHATHDPDDRAWWLGFDCAHYLDACPSLAHVTSSDATYRDWTYVRSQVEALAAQLKAVAV